MRTWSSADSELTYGYFIDEAGVAYKKAHWAVAHRHGLFGLFSDKVTYTTGYRLEPIARSDVVHLLAGGGPHGFNRESRMEAVVSTMSSCLRNSDSTAFRRYA